MADRAETAGLGLAIVGHAGLIALLSLRLLAPPPVVPPPQQAIEVSLAPDVALQASSPPAPTPPAASEAPDQGAPEEEAAPEPEPAPPAPEPKPAAKPAPKPVPRPDPAIAERAAEARTAAHAAWVEKVQAENAAKADRAKAAAAKAASDRAAAADARAAAHAAWVARVVADNAAKADRAKAAAERAAQASEAQAAARAEANAKAAAAKADAAARAAAARADANARAAAAKAEAAARAATAKAQRPRGSRLGPDFLKGLADTPAKTPSAAAPGATMTAKALADIGSAIRRQIQPCADRQVNPAPGQAERIRVTVNLKLNRDGSLAAPPRVINHDGLDTDNRRYLERVDDLAVAAFVGCAPLRGLPGDLYDVPNGWRSISLRYKLPG